MAQLSLFDNSENGLAKTKECNNVEFAFIDLFAGIGGFRIALDSLGGTCVGFSEIDKHAIDTYLKNYKDEPNDNLGDITKIESLAHVDMLVGGVPCQSWSVAGKMKGFDDARGRLWDDVIRLVGQSQPLTFIFENVKGLTSNKNKESFEYILDSFREKGYFVKTEILNSYDFAVPQLRERVFIVGFRKDYGQNYSQFKFPKGATVHKNLAEYLDDVENIDVPKKKLTTFELFGDVVPMSRTIFQKDDELNDFFTMCDTRNGHSTIHSWDLEETTDKQKEIMNAILKNRRKKIYGPKDGNPLSQEDIETLVSGATLADLKELVEMGLLRKIEDKYELKNSKNSSGINNLYRMYMPHSKIFSTLTATGTRDVVVTDYIDTDVTPEQYKMQFIDKIIKGGKYREITIAESQRIQGFPDYFIAHPDEKIAKKQFGNAVSPPVIVALAEKILETGIFERSTYGRSKEARDIR